MCINVKNYNFCCCSRFTYSCCFKALHAQLSISVIFFFIEIAVASRREKKGQRDLGDRVCRSRVLPFAFVNTEHYNVESRLARWGTRRVASRLVLSTLVSSCFFCAVNYFSWRFVCQQPQKTMLCPVRSVCACLYRKLCCTHTVILTYTHTHPFYYKHAQAAQTQWHVTRLLFNLWSRARKNCALWQNLQHRLPMGMGEDQEEEDALLSRLYWQWEAERNAEKEAEWLSYT